MKKRNEKQQLKAKSLKRSTCSLASSLDVIGDKWTLLIVRDLFFGKKRYSEFLASKEGITTNILADRLQHLESAGLVGRRPYQDNPPRFEYYLTETGKTLGPVLRTIVSWGEENIPGTMGPKQ